MNQSNNHFQHSFLWGSIDVSIRVKENYFEYLQMDHVEIRSSKETPISETGYKSEFHLHPCKDWIVDDVKKRLGEPKFQLALF